MGRFGGRKGRDNEIIVVSKIKEERFCRKVATLLFNPLLIDYYFTKE